MSVDQFLPCYMGEGRICHMSRPWILNWKEKAESCPWGTSRKQTPTNCIFMSLSSVDAGKNSLQVKLLGVALVHRQFDDSDESILLPCIVAHLGLFLYWFLLSFIFNFFKQILSSIEGPFYIKKIKKNNKSLSKYQVNRS